MERERKECDGARDESKECESVQDTFDGDPDTEDEDGKIDEMKSFYSVWL